MLLISGLIISTILFAILSYFHWSFNYWKRKGIPYVKPTFPFGTMENPFNRTTAICLYMKNIYDTLVQKGHRHAGLYFFTRPEYLVVDPDLIKNVLQNDFQYFTDRDHYYNEKEDPLSANLFAFGGQKWKVLRAKLTPTFTIGKMKIMFDCVLQISLQMQQALECFCKTNTPIDIKDIVSRYTIDVIGSCAFGLNCNSFADPNAEFRKHGEDIFRPLNKLHSVMLTLAFFKPAVGRFFKVIFFPKTATNFFMETVRDTIKHREANNIMRNDMLQIMIALKKETGITLQEIAAQAFIFFIAGFETSSTTMTFALYELAQNTVIQDKVREEVDRVFTEDDNVITYETIMKLKYTEQVVEETLRKYPPLTFLTRQCVMDYQVPNYNLTIEKGTKVIIPTYGLHYDHTYYPDPEKFDPERFSETNRETINPFTYLPFGGGPRLCIGLRFGIMETKLGIAMLIKNYKFSVHQKTRLPLVLDKYSGLLNTENGIYLNVEKA